MRDRRPPPRSRACGFRPTGAARGSAVRGMAGVVELVRARDRAGGGALRQRVQPAGPPRLRAGRLPPDGHLRDRHVLSDLEPSRELTRSPRRHGSWRGIFTTSGVVHLVRPAGVRAVDAGAGARRTARSSSAVGVAGGSRAPPDSLHPRTRRVGRVGQCRAAGRRVSPGNVQDGRRRPAFRATGRRSRRSRYGPRCRSQLPADPRSPSAPTAPLRSRPCPGSPADRGAPRPTVAFAHDPADVEPVRAHAAGGPRGRRGAEPPAARPRRLHPPRRARHLHLAAARACGCCATSRGSSARRWTPSAPRSCQFPALLPREPYEASNRWTTYGDSIFRLAGPQGRRLPARPHARGDVHARGEGPLLLLQGPAASGSTRSRRSTATRRVPAPACCAGASSS